jgi:hypothetical protein
MKFVRHPGGTFPEKLPDPCQLDAFSNLMAADEVTHQSALEPHIRHPLAAARQRSGGIFSAGNLTLNLSAVFDNSGPVGADLDNDNADGDTVALDRSFVGGASSASHRGGSGRPQDSQKVRRFRQETAE